MTRSTLLRSSLLVAVGFLLTAAVATAVGPLQFFSVTPCRLADTRDTSGFPPFTMGPALQNGVTRNFPVYGSNARSCGVPSTAKAVALNVTVVGPTSFGHLTIWPYNTAIPLVSTLNYGVGEAAIANGAIVPLTADPSFQVSVVPVLGGGGSTNVILDVTGYFQ